MAPREEAGHRLLDEGLLADHHAGHGLLDRADARGEGLTGVVSGGHGEDYG